MKLFDKIKKMKDEPNSAVYLQTIQNEIRPLENIMVGFTSSVNKANKVDEKIYILESAIQAYYDLRSKCVALGKPYEKYFEKMWEHAHNSKNKDFRFIEKFEEELQELQTNRDILLAKESIIEKETINLKEKLFEIIVNAREIKQTDIYNQFDPVTKNKIQECLYFMAKNDEIERIKCSSTYIIRPK